MRISTLLIIIFLTCQQALSQQQGILILKSNPKGAKVFLNGKNTEKATPYQDFLDVGTYNYRLEKENYRVYEGRVEITAGKTASVLEDLIPAFGITGIVAQPEASIFIDGTKKGIGQYSGSLPPGSHNIMIKKEGYITQTSEINITEGKEEPLFFKLEAITGSLRVITEPAGATVLIDNVNYGETPLIIEKIVVGRKTIRIKTSNGISYIVKAEIKKGEFTKLNLTLSEMKGIEIGSFTDSRDYHEYNWVLIGNQIWMAENLAYLPSVSPSSSESYTSPYNYVYGYQGTSVSEAKATSNYSTYGVLYNWPAAIQSCPDGWHLPDDAEWKQLEMYLGMSQSEANNSGWRGTGEGGKLKETGTAHWNSPNTGATNESGFTALPGGYRSSLAYFYNIGYYGFWWSSTEYSSTYTKARILLYYSSNVHRFNYCKEGGFSVRCVRDE